MLTLSIKIINKLGLHARASAKLTQIANQFDSDIWIEKNDKKVKRNFNIFFSFKDFHIFIINRNIKIMVYCRKCYNPKLSDHMIGKICDICYNTSNKNIICL